MKQGAKQKDYKENEPGDKKNSQRKIIQEMGIMNKGSNFKKNGHRLKMKNEVPLKITRIT